MSWNLRQIKLTGVCTFSILAASSVTFASTPTAQEALKLTPVQKDVEYDTPPADQLAGCTIKAEKINGQTGWVIRDSNGQVLREFLDTNGDNTVDLWSYFKDGIEVYRDVDINFNGKPDHFRWLNTAGTRWGIDANEDGTIDSWKVISAEEVTAEIIEALAQKDAARFSRLLLTTDEIKALGLSAERTEELLAKVNSAPQRFEALVKAAKTITPETRFINFGGAQPGLIPAGTNGSSLDVTAYENVVGMTDTGGQTGQVHVGTLIRVGDTWRAIDAPQIAGIEDRIAASGFFFSTAARRLEQQEGAIVGGPSAEVTKLLAELEKIDTALVQASDPTKLSALNDSRATLLERIAEASDGEMRNQFLRQLADTVSAAVQTGTYAGGIDRLQTLQDKLADKDPELAAYVKFRFMTANYGEQLRKDGAQFAEIQDKWLADLAQYVTDHGKSPDAAEAMLQLAMAEEFAGQEEKAKQWYNRIVAEFKGVHSAEKAAGAIRRLESVGKTIPLSGTAINSKGRQTVDISRYRGNVVLVHYWATWCEPCKTDLAQLKELQTKYGNGFQLIGISLDTREADLTEYLAKNRLPWVQLYEEGGLDSRLANEMGILTLPTMILIDDKGQVVNRNIHITELDAELQKIVPAKK